MCKRSRNRASEATYGPWLQQTCGVIYGIVDEEQKGVSGCLPQMKVLTSERLISFTLTAETRCLATMAANWEGASSANLNASQEAGPYR